MKIVFSPIRESFLPSKVSRYMVDVTTFLTLHNRVRHGMYTNQPQATWSGLHIACPLGPSFQQRLPLGSSADTALVRSRDTLQNDPAFHPRVAVCCPRPPVAGRVVQGQGGSPR